ncbi:hypothetical protein, conserved [Eimeria acervulina]|uniref:Transmembrane protein n=1 Tax=Eimeria acervulina TaxID=5801 RepID=U6GPF0_EIMAC|nr:hypothetical protein, conserved [Eimeria acervulina]CDI82081.1 hypothetical protein, conserved [Eimeria acervulina]
MDKGVYPAMGTTSRHSCSTRRMCVGLISVLAVVAITLNYFSICYGWRGRATLSRRLATREPGEEKDPVLSAILDMCLDMEEEMGGCDQTVAAPSEGMWGPHPSSQLLPAYQQVHQEIQATPFSSAMGPFQQPASAQFLQHRWPSALQAKYDARGPFGVDHALTFSLEGPSTSWQGSSMLPLNSGSPLTTANEESPPTEYSWPWITSSPFQNPGLDRSSEVASAPVVSSLPAAVQMLSPVGSEGFLANEQLNIQQRAEHAVYSSLQEDVRLKRQHEDSGFLLPLSPGDSGVPHVLKRQRASPVEPQHAVSDSSTSARHSGGFMPQLGSSAAVAQGFAGPGGLQGFSPSSSVQTAGNSGGEQEAGSHSQTATGAGGLPGRHPYYKLPKLQREAKWNTITFSAELAFSDNVSVNIPGVVLRNLHNCFVKDTLSVLEANDVIKCCQRLVGHLFACHRATRARFTPAEAVATLGRRYIMLDLLVCAIEVLGPAMDTSMWWGKLVEAVPSHVIMTSREIVSGRCKGYLALADRLTAAISLLRKGTRPSEEETIALKRELFCSPDAHPEFKMSRWEPWRSDDKKRGRTQER